MKYVCLLAAERLLEDLSTAEAEQHLIAYQEFMDEIRRSGHFIACQRLQPPTAAATVRVRQGEASITDGPFAETKEQIGGFLLIEARDMNEALQIAARIPTAKLGCVEVRPIAEDQPTRAALGSP
jgi:hypothetical protein